MGCRLHAPVISLVYDPSRGLPIMFGGSAGPNQGAECFNDTWAYHPATNTWTKFDTFEGIALPPRTDLSRWSSDLSGDRLILFGGGPPEPQDFNDTLGLRPPVAVNTYKVFLSHTREDQETALHVCGAARS